MTLLPHHIAGGLLLGGITVGGYFAVTGLTPPKLDDHLSSLGLEVLSSDWASKEADYKAASGDDLISSITKDSGKETITDFSGKLEKWCNKYKEKPFLGEDDANFKRFSLWCTKKATIQTVLEKRGLKALSPKEKTAKLEFYNSEANTDKFLTPASEEAPSLMPKTTTPPEKATQPTKAIEDLDRWCNKQKTTDYKYESDSNLKKVIEWCYKK